MCLLQEYLKLSTLLTVLSAVAYGQYSGKGYEGGGQNEISYEVSVVPNKTCYQWQWRKQFCSDI